MLSSFMFSFVYLLVHPLFFFFFFFNDTATTEIYTLSLHDALPISHAGVPGIAPLQTVVTIELHAGDVAHQPPLVRRSEEHTSELQSQSNLVCRLLLEKKKKTRPAATRHTTVLNLPARWSLVTGSRS